MKSFTELHIWQKGILLMKEIYTLTKSFPHEERYGITSQIRRASISILANIAEGYSRSSSADKAYKYTIGRGECSEVKALLLASKALEITTSHKIAKALVLVEDVGKLFSGLIKKYSQNKPNPNPNPNPYHW